MVLLLIMGYVLNTDTMTYNKGKYLLFITCMQLMDRFIFNLCKVREVQIKLNQMRKTTFVFASESRDNE